MSNWIVRATGVIEDAAKAGQLLEELRAVLANPEHGTGSSEFTSADVSEPNFHQSPPPAAPAPAGPAGGEDAGTEAGGSPDGGDQSG